MSVTAAMVKELREATSAGVLDSKKALVATNGDFDKAVELLREKGLAKAAKKASREANEGQIHIIVNDDGTEASMLAINCETDFVARNESFQELVESLNQQVFESDVSSVEDLLQASYQGEDDKPVSEVIKESISTIGENIVVKDFVKYSLDGTGLIEGYLHFGGRVGVLVEVTAADALSNADALESLAHDLALHIAASRPRFIKRDEVPEAVVSEEKSVLMAQLADENKPDHIKERIVEGRLNKFYQESCLLDQPFVKDDSLSVSDLVAQHSKKLGTALTISRFTRYEIGDA